ncbi:aldehyde dehydrogenase [Favolaschia claudopus]|uniref:Aldehyde dehydrogenase n=1 Tax=Favolaschia claudopus TaxID=2862362 RepID=A0AAW0ANW6_9AGAR
MKRPPCTHTMTTLVSNIPVIQNILRTSFSNGLTRPLEWRKHQILQLARMLQDNKEVFADALYKDLGKPKLEAFGEIGVLIERSVLSAQQLDDWTRPTSIDCLDWQRSTQPTVYMAPKGTVLIIAPWNYPLALVLQPLIGAIAAGCCAVCKPSEIASHTAMALAEVMPQYLDSSAYRVVLGAVAETTKLLELQWDHIFYTGNGRIARIISTAAAKFLTPLTLELGGKSPVIVDPSFDINLAAKRIIGGKAHNGGQICVSPDYIVIPRSHQDILVSALKRFYAEFFPDGSLASDSISRIVSPSHHARLMDLIKRSKSEVAFGGRTEGQSKIELTVFKNVLPEDSLMEDEIFGPLLPIVAVENMDAAIEFVRTRDHPLALYAFTDDPALKKRLLEETLSGAVVFNDLITQLAFNNLPFGGVGPSGYGRQYLKYTFEAFSYQRSSIDVPKELEPFLAARYPPYDDEKVKIMGAAVDMTIPPSS